MTMLGAPLVLATSTEVCDGGQCGGEITLTTDGNRAYAVVRPEMGRRYIGQDCDLILKMDNGDIEVHCAAVNLGDEVCDGRALFPATTLKEWVASDSHTLSILSPMERE